MKCILERRTKHDQFNYNVLLDMRENLKKSGPLFFQVAIRFHPSHPWLKAFMYSFSALGE